MTRLCAWCENPMVGPGHPYHRRLRGRRPLNLDRTLGGGRHHDLRDRRARDPRRRPGQLLPAGRQPSRYRITGERTAGATSTDAALQTLTAEVVALRRQVEVLTQRLTGTPGPAPEEPPPGEDAPAAPLPIELVAPGEHRPVTARTVQGMARVRSGQALAWPLVSDRSVRRGSSVQHDFACRGTGPSKVVPLRSRCRIFCMYGWHGGCRTPTTALTVQRSAN